MRGKRQGNIYAVAFRCKMQFDPRVCESSRKFTRPRGKKKRKGLSGFDLGNLKRTRDPERRISGNASSTDTQIRYFISFFEG